MKLIVFGCQTHLAAMFLISNYVDDRSSYSSDTGGAH